MINARRMASIFLIWCLYFSYQGAAAYRHQRSICSSIMYEALSSGNNNNHYVPAPSEINYCLSHQLRNTSCPFNITSCHNDCSVLGYESDVTGCQISCRCAQAGLFEGDIMFNNKQASSIHNLYSNVTTSEASALSHFYLWNQTEPNGKITIPYVFSATLSNKTRSVIETAIQAVEKDTCIQFVERTDHRDFIRFVNKQGCWSYLGRIGGAQDISVGKGCRHVGIIQHELLHALGFWHEHSRSDRDDYVTIAENNIISDSKINFLKRKSNITSLPYDHLSIMHYHGYTFTRNGEPTILMKDAEVLVESQRKEVSENDKRRINFIYGCRQAKGKWKVKNILGKRMNTLAISGPLIDKNDTDVRTLCSFNTSECEEGECFLGFQVDDHDCPISCKCVTSGLFEGDIRWEGKTAIAIEHAYDSSLKEEVLNRAATSIRSWHWDQEISGIVKIPYTVDKSTLTQSALKAIKKAIRSFRRLTCIKLIPRKTQTDFIAFVSKEGCWSYVGRNRGRQEISIGPRCSTRGIVQHEIMHALGFWHEQSRPDRDQYVTILTENIITNKERNFKKRRQGGIDSLGSPYDYNSIMHYSGYAFSKNSKPTILKKGTGRPVESQRKKLANSDIFQINSLYNCSLSNKETSSSIFFDSWNYNRNGEVASLVSSSSLYTDHKAWKFNKKFCFDGEMLMGNFNHDSRQDLLCYDNEWIKISLANANGNYPNVTWEGKNSLCQSSSAESRMVTTGDFNGDSIDDLLCYFPKTGLVQCIIFSKEDNFGPGASSWKRSLPGFCKSENNLIARDVNGDNLDDLVCTSDAGNKIAVVMDRSVV